MFDISERIYALTWGTHMYYGLTDCTGITDPKMNVSSYTSKAHAILARNCIHRHWQRMQSTGFVTVIGIVTECSYSMRSTRPHSLAPLSTRM